MKILITGTAGFIGSQTVGRFMEAGCDVIGMDNINDYYSTRLKYDRLKASGINESDIHYNRFTSSAKWPNYRFMKVDLEDSVSILQLFEEEQFDLVIHLAAQAGVRHSLVNPRSYVQSNMVGFFNVLEACRFSHVKKLLYASSSSIYGMTEKRLLSISDCVDKPVSLYAATKKSNELMAHVYSHLYGIATVGLRFFTVYGPWGRPDMAPFLFTDAILKEVPIKVFNHGDMQRDFTYIDDIVEGIFLVSKANLDECYSIFNIGNNAPVSLLDFIACLESELGKKARKEMLDMQPEDVVSTWADTREFVSATGYKPQTNINQGVKSFVKWYKEYYKAADAIDFSAGPKGN
ncbi:NAD-dependent epimerase/dehydratase family protein [bacterium]|nr:MAG: NAD-dependent epimerase/dehydratase family protein [bacterium]